MANLLSAHRDLANPVHRAEVARLWDVADVPSTPGLTAVEMFEAAAAGKIKALWISCTNPAQSMPDQATVRKALQRCEFVVVQEAFATTATCDHARPSAARHHLGRKGRYRHQLRAPDQPRARGGEPARTGAARLGHRGGLCAPVGSAAAAQGTAGRHAVSLRQCGIGMDGAPREHAWARPRHHRHELRDARGARPAAMAAARGCPHRRPAPVHPTAAFPRPTAARALPRCACAHSPNPATRATPSA